MHIAIADSMCKIDLFFASLFLFRSHKMLTKVLYSVNVTHFLEVRVSFFFQVRTCISFT
jgi:hypothetical protein